MTSPFGPLVVIANPRSGRGKVATHLREIERILTDAQLSYRIVRTTHPGHATEVAPGVETPFYIMPYADGESLRRRLVREVASQPMSA